MLIGAIFLSAEARAGEAKSAPFALLELFTSEGCSSCPPAEKLLTEIAADAHRGGRRVFVMELHVDYWNHLGWKDPFSSRAFSERQEKYAEALGISQIYTPQLVVNGAEEFVGSDRQRAHAAIASALARPARVSVDLKKTLTPAGLRVDYQVSAAPRGAVLCLALVDSSVTTHVGAGENSGRTLPHTNVAREFRSLPIGVQLEGSLTFPVSRPKKPASLHVIGFVQDPTTLALLGAAGS
jgi:hypothetical protein